MDPMRKTSKASQNAQKKGSKKPATDNLSLSSRAQQHLSVAIAGLVNIIRTCESDTLRVSAINVLLDRGFGKPPQALEVAVWDDVPLPEITDDMTPQEVEVIYRQLVKMPSRSRRD
jgi:hypothetical protein